MPANSHLVTFKCEVLSLSITFLPWNTAECMCECKRVRVGAYTRVAMCVLYCVCVCMWCVYIGYDVMSEPVLVSFRNYTGIPRVDLS